jgi:endonuclease/exonuclease/phosphatase family metal-dependent hydrolase
VSRRALCRLGLSALLAGALGCDPFHTTFDDVEGAKFYRAKAMTPAADNVERLRVMNYNIKFGGGRIDFFFDCHGDRVLMSKREVLRNLEALVEKVNQVDPDVLVIQEVDVNSKRSAFVDEMQWLLDHTALNYGVYASQWRADYVPSDGLGAVDSGNGILSKYPLSNAKRVALALRTDQSGIERYFYLRRNLLRARLDLPDGRYVELIALHADAYGKDGTKRSHVERFEQELDAAAARGALVIGAGDLNTLPPGSEQTYGFPDSVCEDEEFIADDYRPDVGLLDSLYEKYSPEIPLDDYQTDNARYFTHTTDKNGFWNRKLDYIFTNGTVVRGSGLVHQDEASGGMATMPLSDHAPVSVEIEVP